MILSMFQGLLGHRGSSGATMPEMSGVCPSTATQTLCPPEDDGQAQFCGPLLASLAATPHPKALCEDQSWAAERGLNKVSAQVSCCFCL